MEEPVGIKQPTLQLQSKLSQRLTDQEITKPELIRVVNSPLNIAALKRRKKPEISNSRGLKMSLLATGKLIVRFSLSTLPPRAARTEWRKRQDKSSCY